MLFYKILGKKIVFTAHNVNAGKRDNTDSVLNRATLRIQYRLSDNILAHTPRMKDELISDFGVPERSVTVIPYGINNAVPNTNVTRAEARARCGVKPNERAILFFGEIAPYKGLDLLVDAFSKLAVEGSDYRLVIAGRPKGGAEKYVAYVRGIKEQIASSCWRDQVTQRLEFIPDGETELYFKAADVLVLPYRQIFQSGVLFLAFSYGLPVVACDVGAFRDDVIDGTTGFLCAPEDAGALSNALEKFFASDLFLESENSREEIKHFVASRHSWAEVAQITRSVYENLGAFPSR
jgi:glycosyltransferase involved in cell wall biosynthesis